MNVTLLQRLNLSIGIAVILAFNGFGALPIIYIGVHDEVGPETVSVFSPRGEPHEILTPIKTFGTSDTGFIDTGQSVQVYVRNWYKDNLIQFYPRWTFFIALGMVVIHLALNLWKPRRPSGGTQLAENR
ncbi:MAG: hypothetical protein WCJ09_09460 [Planctomycetota bacterium]